MTELTDRPEGAFATLRRGLRMMPEFRRGLPVTFALALIATAGRVVVPIAVQQVIDRGLAAGDPDLGLITRLVLLCAVVVLVTAIAVYRMNVRLFKTTETALAGLRVRAFRHVHDLSVLHQQGERERDRQPPAELRHHPQAAAQGGERPLGAVVGEQHGGAHAGTPSGWL